MSGDRSVDVRNGVGGALRRGMSSAGLLGFLMIASGCSSAASDGSSTTVLLPPTVVEDSATTGGTTTLGSGDDGGDLGDSREGQILHAQPLDPGPHTSDVASFEVSLNVGEGFVASVVARDFVVIESTASTNQAYEAVMFVEADVLAVTDPFGNVRSRVPAGSDLSLWASTLAHSELVAEGEGNLGGLAGRWWKIETEAQCGACLYELLALGSGSWRTQAGSTHKIWALESPNATLLVDIEASTENFDAWEQRVTEGLFVDMAVRGRPSEEVAAGGLSGDFAVGRLEVVVTDTGRQTNPVVAASGLDVPDGFVVPPSESRVLPVSIAYPATAAEYGADMAVGTFPLIIVAPSLGGGGTITDLDKALASHGYVVARVRFPESSQPGQSFEFVGEQPADVSAVLDYLLNSQGPEVPGGLAQAIADQPVGIIGYSLGATTIYGLVGAECCLDARIGAAVAHAGTFHDFDSPTNWGSAPVLLIGSETDDVLSYPAFTKIVDELADHGDSLTFETGRHLAWLDASDENYERSFRTTLEFFGESLVAQR